MAALLRTGPILALRAATGALRPSVTGTLRKAGSLSRGMRGDFDGRREGFRREGGARGGRLGAFHMGRGGGDAPEAGEPPKKFWRRADVPPKHIQQSPKGSEGWHARYRAGYKSQEKPEPDRDVGRSEPGRIERMRDLYAETGDPVPLLRLLARAFRFKECRDLLRGFEERREYPLTGEMHEPLIICLARAGKTKEALEELHRVDMLGVQPTMRSLCALLERAREKDDKKLVMEELRRRGVAVAGNVERKITQLTSQGRVDDARAMMQAMAAIRENSVDIKSYTVLISAFAQEQRAHDAYETVLELANSGLELHLKPFNGALKALADEGLVSKAREVYDLMLAKGVKPSDRTFTTMLRCLLDAKLCQEAVELYRSMGRYHIRPNEFTYTVLLYGLSRWNEDKLREEVMGDMRRRGIVPSVEMFSGIMQGLIKRGDSARAAAILSQVEASGIQMTPLVYSNYIQHIVTSGGSVNDVQAVVTRMTAQGVKPDTVVMTQVMHIMCENKRVSDAAELLRRMPSMGVEVTVVPYNVLLDGLAKESQFSTAMDVFREMQERSVAPDSYTYGSLIEAAGNGLRGDEINVLLTDMKKRGVRPTKIVYNIALKALLRVPDKTLEDALRLMADMRSSGLEPDEYFYNPLVHWLTQRGMMAEALATVENMVRVGIKPTVHTYSSLIVGYCRKGKFKRAFDLLRRMEARGVTSDLRIFAGIVRALSNCEGNVDKSQVVSELVQMMTERNMEPDERMVQEINRLKGALTESIRCAPLHMRCDAMVHHECAGGSTCTAVCRRPYTTVRA
jgi:pentatricopeptide repeat protein